MVGPPICHLPGNVISATVISPYGSTKIKIYKYINLQPEYELRSSSCFGHFRKFGKFELGALSSPPTGKEKTLYTESEFLFVATCASELTFLCSINIRDISGFPKLGAHNPY